MKKVRRLVIIAIFAMLGAMPAMAQFSIGPKIGIAVSDLNFSKNMFAPNNRAGFTGGLAIELMVPILNIGFDASAMYVHRSVDLLEGWSTNELLSRDYIEVPINFKWKIGLPLIGKIITPYLFTGPSFSFLVSKSDFDEFIHNNRCDVAWNFGVGVQLFTKLQIGASYGLGLTNAIKVVDQGSNNIVIEGKNRYWTITSAFLF